MVFFVFRIEAELICIGERIKKGNYRPCVHTIPQSTITGALKDYTGIRNLFALGFWEGTDEMEDQEFLPPVLTCSPRYVTTDSPRLPLFIECLTKGTGKVYIQKNLDVPEPDSLLARLTNGCFNMGALKSKGFGKCRITYLAETTDKDLKKVPGILKSRLYADPENLKRFGVEKIKKPYWGYLFRPTSSDDGDYVKSLFEGSEVVASRFLLNERRNDG